MTSSLEDLVDDRSKSEEEEEQDDAAEDTEEEEQPEGEEEAPTKKSRQSEELTSNKPKSVQKQMEASGRSRPPTESIKQRPGSVKYSEIERPTSKYLEEGDIPSRAEEVTAAGALVPTAGRKEFLKELGEMQAYRTAFVSWQAQQDDYVIYQNRGWDKQKEKDKWEAKHYDLHYLTTGQQRRVTRLERKLAYLRRVAQRQNQADIPEDIDIQIDDLDDYLLKLKLSLYFRMHIAEADEETGEVTDPEDEFEKSSWIDVRDMLESAEWCFQWVPKSRRVKPSAASGSKGAKRFDMIR